MFLEAVHTVVREAEDKRIGAEKPRGSRHGGRKGAYEQDTAGGGGARGTRRSVQRNDGAERGGETRRRRSGGRVSESSRGRRAAETPSGAQTRLSGAATHAHEGSGGEGGSKSGSGSRARVRPREHGEKRSCTPPRMKGAAGPPHERNDTPSSAGRLAANPTHARVAHGGRRRRRVRRRDVRGERTRVGAPRVTSSSRGGC